MSAFAEIDEKIYIDVDSIKFFKLERIEEGFRFAFFLNGLDKPIYSRVFRTEQDAMDWIYTFAEYYNLSIDDEEDFKVIRKRRKEKLTDKIIEGLLTAVFGAIFLGVFFSVVLFIFMIGFESAKKIFEFLSKLI